MEYLMVSFSDLLWLDVCETSWTIGSNQNIELTSDSTTILLHSEIETGTEEV